MKIKLAESFVNFVECVGELLAYFTCKEHQYIKQSIQIPLKDPYLYRPESSIKIETMDNEPKDHLKYKKYEITWAKSI